MEELTNRVSKLTIPKSISFGKKNKSIPQHREIVTPQNKANTSKSNIDVEMKEKKVYPYPRKRGPKKKKTTSDMIE